MSGDPYLDPRTGLFRNRLGLTDRVELATAEKRLTTARIGQPALVHTPECRCTPWTVCASTR